MSFGSGTQPVANQLLANALNGVLQSSNSPGGTSSSRNSDPNSFNKMDNNNYYYNNNNSNNSSSSNNGNNNNGLSASRQGNSVGGYRQPTQHDDSRGDGWTKVGGARGRRTASVPSGGGGYVNSNVRNRLGPSVGERSSSGNDRSPSHQRSGSGGCSNGSHRSTRGRGDHTGSNDSGRQFVRFDKGAGRGTDRDADEAMDGGSGPAHSSRSRPSPYARRSNNTESTPSGLPLRTAVSIDGVDSSISVSDLVAFINKKADPPVLIQSGKRTGSSIVLELDNSKQASTVQRLNGIVLAGSKLIIRYCSKPSSRGVASESSSSPRSTAPNSLESLRNLVISRFNAEARRLDFDRILEDPIVRTERIRVFDTQSPQSKFGQVLCKIIQEACPNLETLSLSGNRLRTLDHFSTLHQRVPTLVNLSLQDNQLGSYRDLEPLNAKEFPNLREVVLIGNPIRERELSRPGGEINYTSNIKRLFPTIHILDMQPVLEEIQFDVVKSSAKLPLDVRPGFMESESTSATAQQFLQMFYSLFDTNRAGLADFYGDNAVFSLSVNNGRPPSGTRGAFQSSSRQSDRAFESWSMFSRNLNKLKKPETRVALAHVGPVKIIDALTKIPTTTHPLGDPPERKRFLVEAINGVAPATYIHISVHGEFKDVAASVSLSFDRTFIIVPAPPGSRSAMANLPFAISNDVWVVRRYTNNYAWFDAVDTVQPVTGTPPISCAHIPVSGTVLPAVSAWPQLPDESTLAQYRIRDNLNDQQHALVIEFAKATGLNYSYSCLCLRQTGWSTEAAGQAFLTAKNMIPAEAFKL
ncbi:hypothetical protein BASA61_009042 [Batrachochytrium salamandrivorans]|nr:hypothetical protein BASA60_006062 [Batrachochytrium salamandrivorans]KAH6581461.1 hypothetical protein BASA61_009042 [Batrachochytrium salamandrivorans]KAH9265413.1 hypothetical protein BASA84_001686 [Batrachochytrium salamandrivorans]